MTSGRQALSEHELLARIFRTLGDSTRLRLIEALLELGQASQVQLIELLGVSQSRASEHLTCLQWCGMVRARRVGRAVHYELCDPHPELFLRLARSFLYETDDAVGGCTVRAPVRPPVGAGPS